MLQTSEVYILSMVCRWAQRGGRRRELAGIGVPVEHQLGQHVAEATDVEPGAGLGTGGRFDRQIADVVAIAGEEDGLADVPPHLAALGVLGLRRVGADVDVVHGAVDELPLQLVGLERRQRCLPVVLVGRDPGDHDLVRRPARYRDGEDHAQQTLAALRDVPAPLGSVEQLGVEGGTDDVGAVRDRPLLERGDVEAFVVGDGAVLVELVELEVAEVGRVRATARLGAPVIIEEGRDVGAGVRGVDARCEHDQKEQGFSRHG